MSSPAYVVVPVHEGENGQKSVDHEELAAVIEHSLKDHGHTDTAAEKEREAGSLRAIIDNSDSLYKYISWEDPVRTLGAYTGCMAVLFGAHYIPLTQFVLKYAATALGAVSLLEFAGRSFTSKTLSARLRPEGGYKKIPEPTLNATLRDVHDLLQASVVAVQKIIYGEDLGKTFTAFLAATGIFWLIKFLNPFALTVLAVTSIFLAPLVNSPQGRETARLAKQRGLDAASTAAESGKQLARDSKAKAAELSSNAQQSASQAASNVNTAAANAYGKASDTAGQLSSKAQDTAVQAREGLGSAYGQASDATGQLSSKAQGTASQAGTGASNAASNATQQARETANAGTTKLSQVLGGKTEAVNTSTGKGASPDSGHSGHGFDTDESASEYITDHNAASSTTGGVIGDVRSSTTGGTLGGGKVFSDVDDASSKYVAADNEAGKQGITNRAGGDIALGETVRTVDL